VHGVNLLAIREPGNDGFAGWAHVGHGGSGHEKHDLLHQSPGWPMPVWHPCQY
jgi:hypothetical protein